MKKQKLKLQNKFAHKLYPTNVVYGYKATNPDMTCLNYQFELGKTFTVHGAVIPCKNGFHFCRKVTDVFIYYHSHIRIFEVYGSDKVKHLGNKSCAKSITFVRELSIAELRDLFKKQNYADDDIDYIEITRGINLDQHLYGSESARLMLVDKRYRLDILINDSSNYVRRQVARQGYGLDVLINDPYPGVRCCVANQGHGLDILINDPDPGVRSYVAQQGYGLDILINDPNGYVRRQVAYQRYGLDILINDSDLYVREVAKHLLTQKQNVV